MAYYSGETEGHLEEPKSQAGNRTIYITLKCCDTIKKYQLWVRETGLKFRKSINDNYFLLFKDNFEPLNKSAFGSQWQTILQKSGISLVSSLGETNFHDLRNSHASNMIHAGLNIKWLQKRMGHASASIILDACDHIFKKEGEAQTLAARQKWETAL